MKIHCKGFVDLDILKGFIDLDISTYEDKNSPGSPLDKIEPNFPTTNTNSKYIAGEDLRLGEMLYLDTTDHAFKATALINCGDDSTKATVAGAARNNTAKGSEVEIAGNGENSRCILDGALVVGKCVYLSTVPGRVTSTMPTASGTVRLKVGVARSTNEVKINVDTPIFNT